MFGYCSSKSGNWTGVKGNWLPSLYTIIFAIFYLFLGSSPINNGVLLEKDNENNKKNIQNEYHSL